MAWTSDFIRGWFLGHAAAKYEEGGVPVKTFLDTFAFYDEGDDADCMPDAPTFEDVDQALEGDDFVFIVKDPDKPQSEWRVDFEGF